MFSVSVENCRWKGEQSTGKIFVVAESQFLRSAALPCLAHRGNPDRDKSSAKYIDLHCDGSQIQKIFSEIDGH